MSYVTHLTAFVFFVIICLLFIGAYHAVQIAQQNATKAGQQPAKAHIKKGQVFGQEAIQSPQIEATGSETIENGEDSGQGQANAEDGLIPLKNALTHV